MSEEPEKIEYSDIEDTLHNMSQSPEYNSFIRSMERALETQPEMPLVHLLAIAVMDMFGPGFVVIGAPESSVMDDEVGLRIPSAVGVAINPMTDMTAQDIIYSLHVIAGSMEHDLVTSDDNLAQEFPNE